MTFTELRYATVLAKTQHFGRAAELVMSANRR